MPAVHSLKKQRPISIKTEPKAPQTNTTCPQSTIPNSISSRSILDTNKNPVNVTASDCCPSNTVCKPPNSVEADTITAYASRHDNQTNSTVTSQTGVVAQHSMSKINRSSDAAVPAGFMNYFGIPGKAIFGKAVADAATKLIQNVTNTTTLQLNRTEGNYRMISSYSHVPEDFNPAPYEQAAYDYTSGDHSSSGLSGGAIAGIVVGCVAFVALCGYSYRRWKNNKERKEIADSAHQGSASDDARRKAPRRMDGKGSRRTDHTIAINAGGDASERLLNDPTADDGQKGQRDYGSTDDRTLSNSLDGGNPAGAIDADEKKAQRSRSRDPKTGTNATRRVQKVIDRATNSGVYSSQAGQIAGNEDAYAELAGAPPSPVASLNSGDETTY